MTVVVEAQTAPPAPTDEEGSGGRHVGKHRPELDDLLRSRLDSLRCGDVDACPWPRDTPPQECYEGYGIS